MPLTNGDAAGVAVSLIRNEQPLDYTKAVEIFEDEYERDGLDVRTLLDSRRAGALTYNDFLILPGYIGNHTSQRNSVPSNNSAKASRLLRSPLTLLSPSASPSRPLYSPHRWTLSPNTPWRYIWPFWVDWVSSITTALLKIRQTWSEKSRDTRMASYRNQLSFHPRPR
jgi:hypothetical protein